MLVGRWRLSSKGVGNGGRTRPDKVDAWHQCQIKGCAYNGIIFPYVEGTGMTPEDSYVEDPSLILWRGQVMVMTLGMIESHDRLYYILRPRGGLESTF